MWLDYIRRSLITSGELRRLIDEDGLRGVTSNPAIFEKAIAGSSDYREILERRKRGRWMQRRSTRNSRSAIFKTPPMRCAPCTTRHARRDGYVSLEVSPLLAHDTAGTLDEARRLWRAVGRDNLMIKVPATPQGIPAVQQLISEGINVNVTLLFAQDAYEQVAEAYIAGLEKFAARGGDLKRVASVASFFISRIDSAIDALIAARLQATTNASRAKLAARPDRQGRDRQRQAHLPALPGALQRAALAGAGRPGRANAALALGQHGHEEPQLSRRRLRRGADRARYGQHDSSCDLRSVSRSRAAARKPHGRCRFRLLTRWPRSPKSASR